MQSAKSPTFSRMPLHGMYAETRIRGSRHAISMHGILFVPSCRVVTCSRWSISFLHNMAIPPYPRGIYTGRTGWLVSTPFRNS